MAVSTSDREPLEELAESFLARFRAGERPSLSEFTAAHPELADQIRSLFPALVEMEQAGSAVGPTSGSASVAIGPLIGTTTVESLGDFRIIREVGRGGMGVVYEAVQESLGRHVALKVFSPWTGTDPKLIERFQREARAAAKLHHTNIVPVFGVGEDGAHRYYAMQFIQGQGLDAILHEMRRLRSAPEEAAAPAPPDLKGAAPLAATVAHSLLTGRFATHARNGNSAGTTAELHAGDFELAGSPQEPAPAAPSSDASVWASQAGTSYARTIARVGFQVAEALAHAHGQGILHRDIKPSNLLLDIEGNVWVTDFGLAKADDSHALTEAGDIVGTVRYMAPERFRGESGAGSDIYGLGVTMYELLTLRPAFEEGDRARLIDHILHTDPPPPRAVDAKIPRDLETIILKAMAKHPADRYTTARALAEDLERFLEDRTILARRSSVSERLWRWCKRNPVVAGAVGTVAAALVAVAVVSVTYATEQAKANKEIKEANQEITRVNREVTGLAGRLRSSLADSNRLLATRNFDRGLAAFDKGKIGPGMLWMIESWRSAIEAGDPSWQHVARANLAAWRSHYPQLKAVFSHPSPAVAAAFSPDGRSVVTGSEDGTARLWNVASGKSIGPPLQHRKPVIAVAFSPLGNTVLTGCEDGTAQIWDPTTGQPIGPPLQHTSAVLSVTFHPDGKIVVTGCRDRMGRLWDAETGRPIGKPMQHPNVVNGVVFSPDGRTLLTASYNGGARLWDPVSGRPMGPPMIQVLGLRSAAFSPDGRTLVTGSDGGLALLRDAASGQPLVPVMQHSADVKAVAFSPDGKTILTGSRDAKARLWDSATGQLLGLLEHQGPVVAVAFDPKGRTLLTASEDGTVRIWDANSGSVVAQVLEFPCADSMFILGHAARVVLSCPAETNYQRYLQLWDPTTSHPIGARIAQPGGNFYWLFTQDGQILLTIEADHTTRRWDATTGAQLGLIAPINWSVPTVDSTLSPDGKCLLMGGKDGTAWIWDIAAGAVRARSPALAGSVDAVAFSPDGKTILTGLEVGEVQLWDAATFAPLGKPFPHPGAVARVCFSPDGSSILVSGEDGTARLWDLSTRTRRLAPLSHEDQGGWMYGLGFSPDGKIIATGSNDKKARLWDAATGQPIGPAWRHAGPVSGVQFSSDGRSLVTISKGFRRLHLPPELPDDLDRMATWVEVITGLTLDAKQGQIEVLDNAAWLQRRDRLESLGGPPETGPDRRLDPILHGPEPTARARRFMDRKQWTEADAAFAEAIGARPFNMEILIQRGELYSRRRLWREAAAYYAALVRRHPGIAPFHEQWALACFLAGDVPGYRAACALMLEHFQPIDDSIAARRVAYACTFGPAAVADMSSLIQVSERCTRWEPSNARFVGAVLFRAGCLEQSLRLFERALVDSSPRTWDLLFLAMIQSGLGRPREASRLLHQADQWIVEADKAPPDTKDDKPRWGTSIEKPLVLQLRREAEALVRSDSVFPPDLFAPE
jgi:WD40 repeat protein/serine/threonine protein kinase/tetratricopeptide (TPR) repeat protein